MTHLCSQPMLLKKEKKKEEKFPNITAIDLTIRSQEQLRRVMFFGCLLLLDPALRIEQRCLFQ